MKDNQSRKYKCPDQIRYIQDLPKQRAVEDSLRNIEKNLIILNNTPPLKEASPNAINIWLFRMERMFDSLKEINQILTDNEKINISLNCIPDLLLEWYIRQKDNIKTWSEFKTQLVKKFSIVEKETTSFKKNDWVRVYNESDLPFNSNVFETGLVIGTHENEFYEITVKGKVLKIHGKNLEKI